MNCTFIRIYYCTFASVFNYYIIMYGKERCKQIEDNVGSNQVESHISKRMPLTNKQKDIVNFCSVPRTSAEIMERLGVSNQTKNRERYITSLVAAGYLQMTNPENPTASNQKYKKVNIK